MIELWEVHNMTTAAPSIIATLAREMEAQQCRARWSQAWPRNRIEIFHASYEAGIIRVRNHCLPDGCKRYVLPAELTDEAAIRAALTDYIARAMRPLLAQPL